MKVIGYTTGVFDMFHVGHLNILRRAKAQCDYLIVGVSTDELVQNEKHKTPIIPFKDRCAIVESIEYVDQVVAQPDKNKFEAWERYHFNKMFVGSDWKGSEAWNRYEQQFAPLGVQIIYLDHTDGISSTILRSKVGTPTMRKIDIKECQERLLNIAKAIKTVSEKHGIPFYMLGGTMLGAIRHKGFIPWDDDMDFGVPYDRYHELIGLLNEELPSRYKCSTFETSSAMLSYFAKVEDISTIVEDIRVDLPLDQQQGINVDIFPLVSCGEEEWSAIVPKVHRLQILNRRVYVGSTSRKKTTKVAKRVLRVIFPVSSKQLNRETH